MTAAKGAAAALNAGAKRTVAYNARTPAEARSVSRTAKMLIAFFARFASRDGKRWGRLSASSNVEKVGTVCSKPPTESDAIVADARAIDGLDDGPAADDSRIRDGRDGATRA